MSAFIARARAGEAATKKLSEGGGLYVTITPAGTPVWRLKYRPSGMERRYSIGTFAEVSLAAARVQRDLAQLVQDYAPLCLTSCGGACAY